MKRSSAFSARYAACNGVRHSGSLNTVLSIRVQLRQTWVALTVIVSVAAEMAAAVVVVVGVAVTAVATMVTAAREGD